MVKYLWQSSQAEMLLLKWCKTWNVPFGNEKGTYIRLTCWNTRIFLTSSRVRSVIHVCCNSLFGKTMNPFSFFYLQPLNHLNCGLCLSIIHMGHCWITLPTKPSLLTNVSLFCCRSPRDSIICTHVTRLVWTVPSI